MAGRDVPLGEEVVGDEARDCSSGPAPGARRSGGLAAQPLGVRAEGGGRVRIPAVGSDTEDTVARLPEVAVAQSEEVQIPADVGLRLVGRFPVEAREQDLDEKPGGGEPWLARAVPPEPESLCRATSAAARARARDLGSVASPESSRRVARSQRPPILDFPCSSDEFVERYGRTKGPCGVRHGGKSSNRKKLSTRKLSTEWRMEDVKAGEARAGEAKSGGRRRRRTRSTGVRGLGEGARLDEPVEEEIFVRLAILGPGARTGPRDVLDSDGLQHWQFKVLLMLRRLGPPYAASPSQLADMLGLTRGALSARLGPLEEEGLIARTHHAADRRRVEVRITDAGYAAFEQHAVSEEPG